MIVGINMHQASGAGLGHHYPATLDHSMNGGTSVATVVGSQSTDRLNYETDRRNESGSDHYAMHHLHEYQHYDSFNSSQQSQYSGLYKSAEGATNETHQFDDSVTRQLPQHSGMLGLEQQFAQFSVQPQEQEKAKSTEENKIPADTENNLEGDESEEDPVKMFVGQIPKTMNEEDIFPTFNSFGPLKDVTIIRDKHTGIHRGCAFVTYWSAADAEAAREALHDKFVFSGAKRAAQVKPAEPAGMSSNNSTSLSMGFYNSVTSEESYVAPSNSTPAESEHKLFVGMLSRTCDEQEVRYLFSRFGEIHEVHLIRDADGTSKCAAFLRFEHKESALLAIEQLNGVEVMDGAQRPLIVKFADSKQQRQQRHIRNVRRHELLTMIGPGGYPYHPQAPPMLMGMHPSVASQYSLPPTGPQIHYGPGDYGHNSQAPPHHYMYPPHFAAPIPQYAYPPQPLSTSHQPRHERPPTTVSSSSVSSNSNPRPREGPAGANLFVYHLPHDLTDADLATAFNPFGNVISAKVYVDKFTGESKGFGFVSYDSVIAAEQAIEQMNGFQIGNKRLKVQHKRVHGSHGGGPSSLHMDATSSQPSSGNNSTIAETE